MFKNLDYFLLNPFSLYCFRAFSFHACCRRLACQPSRIFLSQVFSKRCREVANWASAPLEFSSTHQVILKKTRFGGSGVRKIVFTRDMNGSDITRLVPKGKTLFVYIGPGLPNTTRKF